MSCFYKHFHGKKQLDSKLPFVILDFLSEWAIFSLEANQDDDNLALSEVEIQASPMHGCVSVVMFRGDEIAAPKKEYMFDLRL